MCLGLDPAGPWFDKEDPAVRIDRTDARYVDNMYTNVNGTFITLGLGKPVGHADFYPNGGDRQPGCPHAGKGIIMNITPQPIASQYRNKVQCIVASRSMLLNNQML